jgi:hypothetical protein
LLGAEKVTEADDERDGRHREADRRDRRDETAQIPKEQRNPTPPQRCSAAAARAPGA